MPGSKRLGWNTGACLQDAGMIAWWFWVNGQSPPSASHAEKSA